MNNKRLKILLSLTILFTAALSSFSQTLEIHQLSVGQGDAGLIIIRDTARMRCNFINNTPSYFLPVNKIEMLPAALHNNIPLNGTVIKAILIDTGEGNSQADHILNYMSKMGVAELDHIIISHYDKDHIGGAVKIMQTMNVGSVIDRGNVPTNSTGTYKKYKNAIASKSTNRIIPKLGYGEILCGANNRRIEIFPTTVNSFVFADTPGTPARSKNENDFSLSFVLQYGCFRFFSGGDLSGFNSSNKKDIETPLALAIKGSDKACFRESSSATVLSKGHICAFKINHHGSDHSTNETFLSILQPRTCIISCGYHGHFKHPRKDKIKLLESSNSPNWIDCDNNSVNNTINQYYITSLYEYKDSFFRNIATASSTGVISGNVVIIVDDDNIETQSNFMIFWDGERPENVVKNKDMRTPNSAGYKNFNCHCTDLFIPDALKYLSD